MDEKRINQERFLGKVEMLIRLFRDIPGEAG